MNNKKNKHYQETDKNIKQALLEIIQEDQNPTVAEICRRIHINRTTFYLHYTDIVELMEVVQEDIFKSFQESYKGIEEQVTLMSILSYELFANHVKKNKSFYKFYFRVNTSFPLKDGYDYMWKHILVPYFIQKDIYDDKIMKLRFVCFQAGFTITLKNWVENNCDLSCQEVAKILSECICL